MVTIYHNPRCSKSRQTLALLQDRGINPEIVEYLVTPPSAETLSQLLAMLGMPADALMRHGEDEYQLLVKGKNLSEQEAVQMMSNHPRLIERPIVVSGGKAAIGRPPEHVLTIL
ncbi:MAG: arsenate reductase (glutaredoxin) [Zetaproteobacteria bacterium CG_4_9_14_3_um_filter_49_83]|nr:MAG: arsenate reductase (glutaredoxin) [Zetaproteobacteria bacterium CG1_02_49_23]PIQ33637.1 MAG: arsenate reductase (glutaredoxin) [Zetaproteobacteria bacterium CG17_big_fil_post_rev_8_21_14_2_50_50_13]PIV30124.1 MAG: arsenate reductase (glutaredoxin) [Zetaproteobacteria bacterium CG02_land_8_20_14_3_00_50_9]PIY54543.1 MAG: arsenate reductase (glutaredoxin) [Zetaproteobacteria bacterium CG_4_10_14_0_8_um_filter_49_80]PJA36462.1 MAG: arsenate reductase (glutaredoxin) [Zetaproteobacteria bact